MSWDRMLKLNRLDPQHWCATLLQVTNGFSSELKGHRQPQVFAGELVVGAIFRNTEIRVAANLVNSFLKIYIFYCRRYFSVGFVLKAM